MNTRHSSMCVCSLIALVLVTLMAACTSPPPPPASPTAMPAPLSPPAPSPTAMPAPPPPPAPVPVAIPFDEAILKAANDLFSKVPPPSAEPGLADKRVVVIDPLVDGVSGVQSNVTQSIEARIVELVRTSYPQFEIQPFSAASVAQAPLVLIGTFAGVNTQGQVSAPPEAFRIWLTLADLQKGKIVSKGRTHAKLEGVDVRPTVYFQESPVWTKDPVVDGYIKTCQGRKVGDAIDPVYAEHLLAETVINDAIKAYNSNRYWEALDLYQSALRTPAGEQLRVYNGLYLTHWKLGHHNDAARAFGRMVAYGLVQEHLTVKFLFKPGSTALWPDAQSRGPHSMWLQQIAQHTAQSNACLEIVGHTSRTGPEPLNERLSLRRAEYIQQRLEAEAPSLRNRTITNGKGSRENLVGTATDDARDALDRRVEFNVIRCGSGASGEHSVFLKE
jgi:outer membrane protein OmpA-like peptidoglycan-associated protein